MKNFIIPEEQLQELHRIHRATHDKWAADRIKAIIALGNGSTQEEVARILLLDEETLRNYLKLFKEGGVEKLTQRHYQGSQGKLTTAERVELKQHLKDVTYFCVIDIVVYVEKKYQVKYSSSGMTELLHRLGFVYKKPDITPGKVDIAEQLKFLQQFEELRRTGEPVYSMDGCHPQHNAQPQYGWILKGHTKRLPSNAGRQRLNIQGAVNLDEFNLLSTVHETLDKYSTIELLKKIEQQHPEATSIHVLVDNAGYYRAGAVKDYLKTSRIKLMFLPTYSPHLSLVERIWRYLKRQVLYNRYYPNFKAFKEAVLGFLRCNHQVEFKKLLTEKFHFTRPDSSMIQLPTLIGESTYT